MAGFASDTDPRGVATITLDRSIIHNAFDDALIAGLTAELKRLADEPTLRALVLAARGRSFSAGADLGWMQRSAGYSEAENLRDAQALAELMRTLDTFPRPTLAAVQGNAFAGGLGLIACCDIAIAVDTAEFAVTEVKLGLIPAVISPYLIAAIGARAARRYFLTGERFDAPTALRLGLVHEIVQPDQLPVAVERAILALLDGGPVSHGAAKELIRRVSGARVSKTLIADTAKRIAKIRVSPEGREGIAAFLEKRKPAWRQ